MPLSDAELDAIAAKLNGVADEYSKSDLAAKHRGELANGVKDAALEKLKAAAEKILKTIASEMTRV